MPLEVVHMENLLKGTTDVRSGCKTNRSHWNGSECYRECGEISSGHQEKIDIKKATALGKVDGC